MNTPSSSRVFFNIEKYLKKVNDYSEEIGYMIKIHKDDKYSFLGNIINCELNFLRCEMVITQINDLTHKIDYYVVIPKNTRIETHNPEHDTYDGQKHFGGYLNDNDTFIRVSFEH